MPVVPVGGGSVGVVTFTLRWQANPRKSRPSTVAGKSEKDRIGVEKRARK
jgi:hypothetical protein